MQVVFKYSSPITATTAIVGDTDFKKFYPRVNTNMAWSEILPYVEQATEQYIIPFCSKTLYNAIAQKFNAGTTLTTTEAEYLRLIQIAAAYYTAAYAYSKELDITSSIGAVQDNAQGANQTPQWAFRQKLFDLTKTADKALDNLLTYLDEQSILPQTPKSIPFFNTLTEFENCHDINGSHRTFRSLRTLVINALDLYIIPQIGNDTIDALATQYIAKTLTSANALLIPKLQKTLAKFAIALAANMPTYTIEAGNLFALSNNDGYDGRTQTAKMTDTALESMGQTATAMAKKYMEDLVNFLAKNADTYPIFKAEKMPDTTAKSDNIHISPDLIGGILLS